MLVEIQAAGDGLKAGIGYGRLAGSGSGGERGGFMIFPAMGGALKFSMIRTFGDAANLSESLLRASEDASYLGGEVDLTLLMFQFSLGLFRRIDNRALTESEREWLLNVGLGAGF